MGVGDKKDVSETIPSRNTSKQGSATVPGHGTDAVMSGSVTDGELTTMAPGSRYSATLNERQNKSLNRNAGPGRPSANEGKLKTPAMSARKTGKV
jgi:hypothetical protein